MRRDWDDGNEVLLAPARRKRIVSIVERQGAASVAQLAELLGVAPNTIRRDLDILDSDGLLVRSHGGAVARERPYTRLPYLTVSQTHVEQKEWIARAALNLLPDEGSVFLADGTTVLAFAMRIPANTRCHVVTNSVKIAVRLVTETSATVEVLGGTVRRELLATDCSLAVEALDMLYWDIAFVGAAGLDVESGITERDAVEARRQRKFIDRATRVVALCDSSKIGRCSYAKVGPITLLDTVVTDEGIADEDLQALRDVGVEVLVAGPDHETAHATEP